MIKRYLVEPFFQLKSLNICHLYKIKMDNFNDLKRSSIEELSFDYAHIDVFCYLPSSLKRLTIKSLYGAITETPLCLPKLTNLTIKVDRASTVDVEWIIKKI
ncbi:unnamed protein product, partial [Didymodactylos carnosus]